MHHVCRNTHVQHPKTMFTSACATLELWHTSFRKISNCAFRNRLRHRSTLLFSTWFLSSGVDTNWRSSCWVFLNCLCFQVTWKWVDKIKTVGNTLSDALVHIGSCSRIWSLLIPESCLWWITDKWNSSWRELLIASVLRWYWNQLVGSSGEKMKGCCTVSLPWTTVIYIAWKSSDTDYNEKGLKDVTFQIPYPFNITCYIYLPTSLQNALL